MDLSPRRSPVIDTRTANPARAARSAAAVHLATRPTAKPAPAKPATPVSRAKNHTPAAPPKAAAHEQQTAHLNSRLEQAKQVSRSPIINKFAGASSPHPATPASPKIAPKPRTATPSPGRELPAETATQHAAMARLITSAPAATPSGRKSRRAKLSFTPHASRVAATLAAVAIMGTYIWIQNYPKLALQTAGSKAGLSASLPGYMPSSYTLAHTDTKPGLVTLSFSSPSSPERLKIAQTRTAWDSSSLLDNYVIKHADDYATVQGQGLTVYLFNHNQAAWVNHGIWYSIEGASRLSREQILKIAYSL